MTRSYQYLIVAGLLLLLGVGAPVAAAAGPLTGWTYDPLEITIPAGSVTEPLDNFPVMIKLDRDAGANGADLRGILAVLGSDANRKRIAVATADGTLCPVEIAEWSTADLQAVLWVKVPRIEPGQDTKLYLYFDPAHAEMTQYVGDTGEPAAQLVWDEHYAGVWLMKPNGGRVLDSTANGNHGTIYGATATEGPLGTALAFDGVDDYILIPYDESLQVASQMTLTVWLNHAGAHQGGYGGLWYAELDNRYRILLASTSGRVLSQLIIGGSYTPITSQGAIPPSEWWSIDATYDGSSFKYWFQGIPDVTSSPQSGDISPSNSARWIGRGHPDTYWYAGLIAFESLSSVARSPAWIAAQNAVLHDTFVTYSYDSPPIAGFHTTPAHTLTVICTDLSFGNPTSWHWDFGDGTSSTEQNPTHTYASPGTYTITLTVTNAYGTDSSSQTLRVAPPSSVSFTYTVDGPELATGTPIRFQGLISSDATSWRWYFGDGATSEERNPTHTYSKTGTYRVTLTATNAHGSISFSQNLHVFTGTIADPTPPPTHGAAFRWDPETGYYTSYWFNREGSFIDVHGLFFALMLPLTQIFGSWVFLIIWGTLCMGLYLYTQDTTMPFIVGILGGSMMAFLMGEDALVVMLLTMAFAGGGILAKVLLGRV